MAALKGFSLVAVAVGAVLLGPLVQGTPLVFYTGTEAGGASERQYAYHVDAKEETEPIVEFRVGTADLDPANYTNLLIPDGWTFTIDDEQGVGRSGQNTPIGEESPAPVKSLTPGSIVWSASDSKFAIWEATFGFDHSWAAGDVGWELVNQKDETFNETWGKEAPVGMGAGWVHAPCTTPEPATVLLFVMGTLMLGRRF